MWKLINKLCFHAFFGFVYTNHGVWVQASTQNDWHRSLRLKTKDYEAISTIFFYFGSNMPKTEWWTHVSYGLMSNNDECICRKVGKRLRRPALHAFIIHCGTKSTWIAPPITLTDSYIRFLSKAQLYVNSLTQTPKSKPYFFTLPNYTVLIHSWVV